MDYSLGQQGERDREFAAVQAHPEWQEIWAQHPNENAYLVMNARFMKALLWRSRLCLAAVEGVSPRAFRSCLGPGSLIGDDGEATGRCNFKAVCRAFKA